MQASVGLRGLTAHTPELPNGGGALRGEAERDSQERRGRMGEAHMTQGGSA